jgi:hypothetical protein
LRITSRTSGVVPVEGRQERSSLSTDVRQFKPVKPVIGLRLTQSIIAKCLFNNLVSFYRTVTKFEAKLDANMLLLHVQHFNEKKITNTTL